MVNVLHSVSVMDRAGQETLLMNVFKKIDRSKINFSFLCTNPKKGDYDSEIIELGGEIHVLPNNKKICKVPFVKYAYQIYIRYSFFKKHKEYQIFHIHNYHAFSSWIDIVAAKLGGVENIILHSHNSDAPHRTLHKIFRVVVNKMKITRLACSDLAAEWMYGKKYVHNHPIIIIKNGIEAKKFQYNEKVRNSIRNTLAIDKDKLIIGHVGRFNYQKNHKFIINTFREILKKNKNAELWLIGQGELEDTIKHQVKELKIQDYVKFLGIREDVDELLQAMDVFFFPSLFEGFGIVLIEAQATGLPCVTSTEVPESVKVGEHITFLNLKDDVENWVNALLGSKNKERKNEYKKIVEKGFDIEETVKTLEKIYMNFGE